MKISQKTVRRLINRGDLAAYKLGDRGQLRVEQRELERYVEARRVEVVNGLRVKGQPRESSE